MANVENDVYFESFVPNTVTPADFSATVVDSLDNVITTVNTKHFGRGRFILTPLLDEPYYLVVDSIGRFKIDIPIAKYGIALSTEKSVYKRNDLVTVMANGRLHKKGTGVVKVWLKNSLLKEWEIDMNSG